MDENLQGLELALEDNGFKVILPLQGLTDEALKRKARGWAILTKNSQGFVDDAVRYDDDMIGIKDVKFIDDQPGRTNATVCKISQAARRSQLATPKGNFWLKVRDRSRAYL